MRMYQREFVTKVMGSVIARITLKAAIVKSVPKVFLEMRGMGECVTISANQSQLSKMNKVVILVSGFYFFFEDVLYSVSFLRV